MSDRLRRLHRLHWLLLLLVLVAACSAPEPAPTPPTQAVGLRSTSTPTAPAAPTPTFASTAMPTHTPAPTSTHAPTSPLLPDTPTPTSTYTPAPPSPTSTPSPSPTDTPTATSTPTPFPTDTPTLVPPSATPEAAPTTATRGLIPPTPTAPPKDDFQFDITMQRMLHIDENGGDIGNHNIYVHAFKADGQPLNGVVICRVYALQLQPPDPHACGIAGETGPGRMHFDVYSGDIVYVATADPEHRPLSPYTRPLEQEPANMAELQELVDNGYCASVEDCEKRIPINNLVRFHYSYEVHFTRRW